MTRTGAFTPSDARMVLEVARYLRENGFVIPPSVKRGQVLQPTGIYFRNDSGGEVPAFACMEVTGTVEAGSQNYITITKPTSSALTYLFNGQAPVADGDYGTAQSGPVYRVYKNTGTVTEGNRWAPTTSQWYLTKGAGQFVVLGSDDIGTDAFRVMRDDVARLYRFTLNATLASGTADADILEMDGTDTNIDATVRDPLGIFAALTAVNSAGLCLYQDGKYYVIQAACP